MHKTITAKDSRFTMLREKTNKQPFSHFVENVWTVVRKRPKTEPKLFSGIFMEVTTKSGISKKFDSHPFSQNIIFLYQQLNCK